MERKFGFSVNESGVGGILVVVPMARFVDGGDFGRRERICVFGEVVGWTYCLLSTGSLKRRMHGFKDIDSQIVQTF
jgi:hypothetical protein